MVDPVVILGKGLHLAHCNVRSMLGRNKFDMIKHQIEASGVDIFTLSETWLSSAIPDKTLELPGYNLCRLDRTWKSDVVQNGPKKGEASYAM